MTEREGGNDDHQWPQPAEGNDEAAQEQQVIDAVLAAAIGSATLTVAARRPEKLDAAAQQLRDKGYDVQHIAGNLGDEGVIAQVVEEHRQRFGRLDVLVNNAGVGIGGAVDDYPTKKLDTQIAVNFRAIVLFYRECSAMLRAAGKEHNNALVVNTASIAGKQGQGWLSVYSATKAAVVGFTEAMNKELGNAGIKSCALCPAFVDTAMTDFVKEHVGAENMIQPSDISETVRALLHLSPSCVIPEILYTRPGAEL